MAELTTRRRNARKDTLTKTVIPRIEHLLEEIKQFDRYIFDATEDDEIENDTCYTTELSSNVKKIVMKIRKKI